MWCNTTIVSLGILVAVYSGQLAAQQPVESMLKSKLRNQYSIQQPRESLLSRILHDSNLYESLLGNPDFAKMQDMTHHLWRKHNNPRGYIRPKFDEFITMD